jgi:CRISPR system Cascade subunit CasD
MKTLTIQLNGLLGAWSTAPKSEWRLTKQSPQPSHIVGLLACCMGLGREDDWLELRSLRIAVRTKTDIPPETMRDYHTLKDAVTNDGNPGRSVITQREYIITPSYIVDISGDDAIIDNVSIAVRYPVWQPYLGRRCCVPSTPLVIPVNERVIVH